ncbi:genomic island protein [Delftia deserti]|uniref:Genomic island protein n=1 Tax=Delftia deserti TaxID=1651218 RepID=A0ABW5EYA5_9BURK
MATALNDDVARENWARYLYGKDRGHREYTENAARCEGMYLGGGEQWSAADKALLDSEGRPHYEFNEIMASVNSAIGYQIHNRMDIAYKPRGAMGDLEVATILSKVAKQVADMTKLHWVETQVFGDGLVEQRGYYELRMDFERNIKGEIAISALDPRDVIPDPDAKAYDPDQWGDVIITRWLTLDEIEQRYGKAARTKVEESQDSSPDFGDFDDETERSKFGTFSQGSIYDAFKEDGHGFRRYRIIDRQQWVYELTKCLVYPMSGDVVMVDTLAEDSIADALRQGAVQAKRMRRRIKWTASTWSKVLHDDYSPYDHFTVVPYFGYFRRGKTRGMVDNAIGPQEVINKAVSQFVHILNSSANGGWMVEQNSLTNMDTEELETMGATTGLVIEYAENKKAPQKIQPNTVPTGVDRIIDRADRALKDVTVPEAMRGSAGPEVSGIAIQSKQFASQQQLAVPLDNLAYTRHLLAGRITKLIQRYYDSHRIFRITETDPMTGKPEEEVLEINKFDQATGAYLNDVTVGEYDVVISEQPMQVTFENSQFQQALEMRNAGIRIPDATVLRYSSLADKHEILAGMEGQQQPPVDPRAEAQARLYDAQARRTEAEVGRTEAQTTKLGAETVNANVEGYYSAVQTAQILELTPGTAPTADQLLRSAGSIDHDAAPIVAPPSGVPALPAPEADAAAGAPTNTDPLTPANPAVGLMRGIRTPGPDGAQQP